MNSQPPIEQELSCLSWEQQKELFWKLVRLHPEDGRRLAPPPMLICDVHDFFLHPESPAALQIVTRLSLRPPSTENVVRGRLGRRRHRVLAGLQ